MGSRMEKESLFTQMGMCMKAIGKMERQMATVYFNIIAEANMRAIGKMINKVGLVQKLGLMATNTKDNINMARKMGKEYIDGQMVAIIKEIGSITK